MKIICNLPWVHNKMIQRVDLQWQYSMLSKDLVKKKRCSRPNTCAKIRWFENLFNQQEYFYVPEKWTLFNFCYLSEHVVLTNEPSDSKQKFAPESGPTEWKKEIFTSPKNGQFDFPNLCEWLCIYSTYLLLISNIS